MSFNKSNCVIRKIYCGDKKLPKDTTDQKYSRRGSSFECLKKGYGASLYEQKKKSLPKGSLQQISYIGPVYEGRFKRQKIYSMSGLVNKCTDMTASEIKELVSTCCTKKGSNVTDQKAFNNVMLFLYKQGFRKLPNCKVVKE